MPACCACCAINPSPFRYTSPHHTTIATSPHLDACALRRDSEACTAVPYLLAGPLPPGISALDVCRQLLAHFDVDASQYRIGRTRLFFRAGMLGQLEDAAARMQRCGPAWWILVDTPLLLPATVSRSAAELG